jgi:AcrR family transcriptional regulator
MAKKTNDSKRDAALQAMMESETLTEAAQKAGISRTTLWEYLRDKDFKTALQRMKESRALAMETEAVEAKAEALAMLKEIMTDTGVAHVARISAAKLILAEANETIQHVESAKSDIINRGIFDFDL